MTAKRPKGGGIDDGKKGAREPVPSPLKDVTWTERENAPKAGAEYSSANSRRE
ncbi:hypothetical protein PLANPX_2128 [Lacipirellula parvula]|uniref:Uncharacterized protein n=1 Tax=Lacipirellula parvula TaxID=2650471 RepID=A0A5K7XDU7_9BACT|nr:hypothetical protein PLANPX_2128 [Lacipirellula parvula]